MIGGDLFINREPLKTGFRIELADDSDLVIVPVVENPDQDAPMEDHFLDRTKLERQLFGAYYLFPDMGFFKISACPPALPQEYFSPQKKNVIPSSQITDFLNTCGATLKAEPSIIVDESLLNRETVNLYEKWWLATRRYPVRKYR